MQRGVFQCPNCGSQNPEGFQFCGSCGGKILYNCLNCGGGVNSMSRFCPHCGVGLGWGRQLQDIQSQLAKTEEGLRSIVSKYSDDIQSQVVKNEDALKSIVNALRSIVSKYSDDIQSQLVILNKIENSISRLVAGEQRTSRAMSLNKSGLGIMGLGLGVLALSFAPGSLPNIAIMGIIVIAIGFLLQLVTNFMRG